jgi:amino acid transporter
MFTILTFIGFEATAIYRDEVRDPDKTIARATFGSIAILAVLYTITSYLMVTAWGTDAIVGQATDDPGSVLAGGIDRYAGAIMSDVMVVLLLTSALAALLAIHNTTTRYLFSLASDGAAPRALGKVHPRHGSPYLASIGAALLAAVALIPFVVSNLSFLETYSWLLGTGTFALIVLYVLTSLAIIVFFVRNPGPESVFVRIVAPALGLVSLVITLGLVTANLSLLTGGSPALSVLFQAFVYGLLLAGVLVALRYRTRKPDVYEALGRSLS